MNDPPTPSVPPTEKQVDDLFQQWFDEEGDIPPVVPIPPDNEQAAQVPENAYGSPSTTLISEGAPCVTLSPSPSQPLHSDTSDSDLTTPFDHLDSNLFPPYLTPETVSEASSSNTVNVDVSPDNPLPHL